MQILGLATDPETAAELHCDLHVGKLAVEAAQLLYTHLHHLGIEIKHDGLKGNGKPMTMYEPTHAHHPACLWLDAGRSNFFWLLELGMCLCARYHRIYGQPQPIKPKRRSKKAIDKSDAPDVVEFTAPKFHATQAHFYAIARQVQPEMLPTDCGPEAWIERLLARGIDDPNLIARCKGHVCTTNPPDGCRFGVACVDELVPLAWGDKSGSYDWVATMRDYLGWKSVHQPGLVNMKWNKSSTPPPALRDHVCWYGE